MDREINISDNDLDLFLKPVLILDVPTTLDGFEATELDRDNFWELNEREKIGEIFSEQNIEQISKKVRYLIDNPPNKTIEELKNKSVYNWNCAGETAANQIISIINNIK